MLCNTWLPFSTGAAASAGAAAAAAIAATAAAAAVFSRTPAQMGDNVGAPLCCLHLPGGFRRESCQLYGLAHGVVAITIIIVIINIYTRCHEQSRGRRTFTRSHKRRTASPLPGSLASTRNRMIMITITMGKYFDILGSLASTSYLGSRLGTLPFGNRRICHRPLVLLVLRDSTSSMASMTATNSFVRQKTTLA